MKSKKWTLRKGEAFAGLLVCVALASFGMYHTHTQRTQQTNVLSVSAVDNRLSNPFGPYTILPKSFAYKKTYPLDPNHYQALFPDGELIHGSNNDVNDSDSVTLAYRLNWEQNRFNCHNQIKANNQVNKSLYYVNGHHQLVCVDLEFAGQPKSEPVVLVENVESMQIRYGEDGNGDGAVDRYVATFDPSYSKILNINISLLIKTPDTIGSAYTQKIYTVQDAELGPFRDNLIRKVYTTTVNLQHGLAHVSDSQRSTNE